MEEQLIEFKTAELAKEKGFDIRSNKSYYAAHNVVDNTNYVLMWTGNKRFKTHLGDAPTQSLLQKWLRENEKLKWSILVYIVPYFSPKPRQEQCFIWRRGALITLKPKSSYEEALEEGLQEALKLV